jgi:2'-5' RNA ligase
VRLFFALLPDADTTNRLTRTRENLQLSCGAQLLAPQNYHVTLAFTGEVCEADVAGYRELGAALTVPSCPITLDACEYWRPSQAVVFAARDNPPELATLVNELRASIARARAWSADERWRAHATVARKVVQAPVLKAMSSISWMSRSFALMRSESGQGHAVYTAIDSWSLLDKR